MRKVKVGKYFVPLWLVIALLVAGVGASSYYVWKTLTILLEVREPLEIVSYPTKLSLYPGQTIEFDVTITNHASINYTVMLDLSLDNKTYQVNYVTFSQETYFVVPGDNILKAWLKVEPGAPPTNTTLSIRLIRGIVVNKVASGKIAYDTFSAFNGIAPDMSWTIVRGKKILESPVVENGELKTVSDPESRWITAYLAGINLKDFIFEVKVKPVVLTHEGPEILIWSLTGEEEPPRASFDYYHSARMLRVMIGPTYPVLTTYKTTSFVMSTDTWYVIKIIISKSNMQCYLNNALIFNVTDQNVTPVESQVWLTGFESGEWGYWDDVKIWKSNTLTFLNLREGHKVELYDNFGTLKVSGVVEQGGNKAVLDVSNLSFPFNGYFKIYASDGTLICQTPIYNDIWGGDEYSIIPSS